MWKRNCPFWKEAVYHCRKKSMGSSKGTTGTGNGRGKAGICAWNLFRNLFLWSSKRICRKMYPGQMWWNRWYRRRSHYGFCKSSRRVCRMWRGKYPDIHCDLRSIYNDECHVYTGRCKKGLLEIWTWNWCSACWSGCDRKMPDPLCGSRNSGCNGKENWDPEWQTQNVSDRK